MSDNRLFDSFALRLFGIFSGLFLLLVASLSYFMVMREQKSISDELQGEGIIIASLLSESLRTWIFAENVTMLEVSLNDISSRLHIASVSVFNAQGKIIFGTDKGEGDGPGPHRKVLDPVALMFDTVKGGLFNVSQGKTTIDVICPVTMAVTTDPFEDLYFEGRKDQTKQTTIGYIRVAISKKTVSEKVRTTIGRWVGIGVGGLLVGLVVLFLTIRQVTRPLSQLTEAVRLLGEGSPAGRLVVRGRGEVVRLADAFNTMKDNLQKREEEKAELEEKLRQSEKLEALGRLARGIAHDFNNILSTVQGSVYLLEKKFQDHMSVMQYVERIQKSLIRSKGLIQNIILFSRAYEIRTVQVDINVLLTRMMPFLRELTGGRIELELNTAKEDLIVSGDAVQFEQVVMNLVSNARDAMPGGGKISVRTEKTLVDSEFVKRHPALKAGAYAVIRVADPGSGVPEEIRTKIFEPFFTTKEHGHGSGLGLSIVHGIVEQHKGSIEITPGRDQGTEFVVYLPIGEDDGNNA